MARAYRGPYARPSSVKVPYATASVWGTGVDAIHGYYGEGPPLRVLGRAGASGSSPVAFAGSPRDDRDYQEPGSSSGHNPPQELVWGYPVYYGPDSFGMGADSAISAADTSFAVDMYMDGRPSWDTPPEQDRVRRSSLMPSWGRSAQAFRATREGAHRYRRNPREELPGQGDGYQPVSAEPVNSNPTETVSEGWENKVTSFTAYASPSADEQIFVQTSMRQRFGTRDNHRAQLRDTDEPRHKIASRVMAMVEKRYSMGERLYDMAPYQQDEIRRPFRSRTAGTGPQEWMTANEFSPMNPYQRTPPPDPAMGVPEVANAMDYGYTNEDGNYYG